MAVSYSDYLREQLFTRGQMYEKIAAEGADPLMPPSQVASILLIDRRTVRRWANEGRFSNVHYTEGGQVRLRWSVVREYAEAQVKLREDRMQLPAQPKAKGRKARLLSQPNLNQ